MQGGSVIVTLADAGGNPVEAYLTRPEAGSGPGLVLFDENPGNAELRRRFADFHAAEGYVVLAPESFCTLAAAAWALRSRGECTGKVGALGFGEGGGLVWRAAAEGDIDGAVLYDPSGIVEALDLAPRISIPLIAHFAGQDGKIPAEALARVRAACAGRPEIAVCAYPGTRRGFARPGHADFDKAAAGLAHSRSIAVLRRTIGPCYDLEALWEAHTTYEFATRDVDATMRTMVADPYVNHVPVMTGGVGAADLARFYANHFIPKLPADTRLVPISRTVGADCLVDEMLFCFTHDTEIDFMLPGVPPTGKYVEVPTVAIVKFRGGKLCHEHIYWDQASVLVQIGLIDPNGLPVAGVATARKLADETRPSNTLMTRWAESEPTGAAAVRQSGTGMPSDRSNKENGTMAAIPDSYLDLVEQKKAFAHLATIMPDGSPQVTPVWLDYAGGRIRINTAKGRVKARNLKPGARVALSIQDPDNAYRYVQIRGRVAEMREEGADAHIDALARKYLGEDKYPFRQPGEVRVMYEIEPVSVSGNS